MKLLAALANSLFAQAVLFEYILGQAYLFAILPSQAFIHGLLHFFFNFTVVGVRHIWRLYAADLAVGRFAFPRRGVFKQIPITP